MSEPGLFGGVLGRGGAAREVSDAGWLRALLDVERALARACADAGLVPAAAADAVAVACDPVRYDVDALGVQAADSGNPVVPLVRALEREAGPEAAGAVHHGATSQDVLDSAMVLVAVRASRPLLADLRAAADSAADLAQTHRDTVVVGRTLLQPALPTTFGLKAAGWALALDAAAARLDEAVGRLPAQLGGAVGTLGAYGGAAQDVVDRFAALLGLPAPVLPWHTARGPVLDLAAALGHVCAVTGKVALDVVLLAQGEVAEVREGTPGRGGSSAMPHKRNPVAAVSARAASLRGPGLVATLMTAAAQEHERGAGGWHAEWEALSGLLRAAGSAAAWTADGLGGLEVDADRMAAGVGAAQASSAVADALTPSLGRTAAHHLVSAAVDRAGTGGRSLRDELAADPACTLDAATLDRLTTPDTGQAGPLVDRALASRGARA